MHFIWPIFFSSAYIICLFLIILVICVKYNEAVTNSCYKNVCITINDPLKFLLHHFLYFYCSNFKMTFDKNIMTNAAIFKFLPNFYYVTKFYVLATFGNDYPKCLLNNSSNLQKNVVFFVCLVYV